MFVTGKWSAAHRLVFFLPHNHMRKATGERDCIYYMTHVSNLSLRSALPLTQKIIGWIEPKVSLRLSAPVKVSKSARVVSHGGTEWRKLQPQLVPGNICHACCNIFFYFSRRAGVWKLTSYSSAGLFSRNELCLKVKAGERNSAATRRSC